VTVFFNQASSKSMWTKQRRRSSIGRFILPLLSVVVVAYFGYHIYHGQYGLNSYQNVANHIHLLEEELGQLERTRDEWQSRLALLKDGSIEKDMLDEYVRRNLNVAKPNELTILVPKK